jgi:hypothetical protein
MESCVNGYWLTSSFLQTRQSNSVKNQSKPLQRDQVPDRSCEIVLNHPSRRFSNSRDRIKPIALAATNW